MRTKPFFARALLVLLGLLLAPATAVYAEEDIQLLMTTDNGAVSDGRDIDIFCNDDYYDRVLKPGSEGMFAFAVTNPEEFAVDFRLAITEENLHGVPIEFCLVADGRTVTEDGDEWLSAEELADHEECLAAGATRQMTLHWRWQFTVDEARDAADTELGGHAEATAGEAYALWLDIYAEQSDLPGDGDGGEDPRLPGKAAQGGGTNPVPGSAGGPAEKPGQTGAALGGGDGYSNTAGAPAYGDDGHDGAAKGVANTVAQTGDTNTKTRYAAILFGALAAGVLLPVLRRRTTT